MRVCDGRPSWNLAGVVFIITIGLTLLVFGETQFDLRGFIVVMSASALSGLRWTITQLLLQGNDAHGVPPLPLKCTWPVWSWHPRLVYLAVPWNGGMTVDSSTCSSAFFPKVAKQYQTSYYSS